MSQLETMGSFQRTLADDLGRLQKALSASSIAGGQGASSMIPEDLEAESYNQVFSDKHFKLLRRLPVIQATSNLHELTQISDITDLNLSGFYTEGGLPNSFAFNSQRVIEQIKSIGEVYAVTGVAGAVQSIGGLGGSNLVDTTERAKMLAVQYKMTKEYYFSNTLGLASTTKFRGIEQIINEDGDAEQVIDLNGYPLTEEIIDASAEVLAERWGFLSDIHCNSKVVTNFSRTIQGFRQLQGVAGDSPYKGIVGKTINRVRHSHGEADFTIDNFLQTKTSRYNNPPVYTAEVPVPPNAPATPLIGAIALSLNLGVGSNFDAEEVADFGTYTYAITADNSHSTTLNNTGESTAVVTASQAVAVDDTVDIDITTDANARSYKIYRSVSGTNNEDFIFIGEIVNDNATITFTDTNAVISHTQDASGEIQPSTVAFGFSLESSLDKANMRYEIEKGDSVCRVQLLPIFKRQLPIIGDESARALIASYTCVESPYPKRNILYKNVGNRGL